MEVQTNGSGSGSATRRTGRDGDAHQLHGVGDFEALYEVVADAAARRRRRSRFPRVTVPIWRWTRCGRGLFEKAEIYVMMVAVVGVLTLLLLRPPWLLC